MSVFEAGKTYQTRGGNEAIVYAVDRGLGRPIHGAIKAKDGSYWVQISWGYDGREHISVESDFDLIPPEPPIPPVVVSDAVVDAWSKGPYLAPQAISSVIPVWLREHPHALAGYRRDCAERRAAALADMAQVDGPLIEREGGQ